LKPKLRINIFIDFTASMDPYYFINDLSIAPNKDGLELHDIYEVSPDGAWTLGQKTSAIIVHENENYNYLTFNNETKELTFITNNQVVKRMTLSFNINT
jgi:hypothetical protein